MDSQTPGIEGLSDFLAAKAATSDGGLDNIPAGTAPVSNANANASNAAAAAAPSTTAAPLAAATGLGAASPPAATPTAGAAATGKPTSTAGEPVNIAPTGLEGPAKDIINKMANGGFAPGPADSKKVRLTNYVGIFSSSCPLCHAKSISFYPAHSPQSQTLSSLRKAPANSPTCTSPSLSSLHPPSSPASSPSSSPLGYHGGSTSPWPHSSARP